MEKLTIGKQLQNEVEDALYDENILKHWSLREYNINPIYLNATLEDVKNYWNEEVRFREGFEIDKENKIVKIPNFYIKIDGVYKDRKKYISLLNDLSKGVIFHNTPIEIFTNVFKCTTFEENNEFKKVLNKVKKDKPLTLENLKSISFPNNKLLELNSYILNYLIKKLNEFISINKNDYSIKNILLQLVDLNKDIFNELNNWDFGFQNPKITIINENKEILELDFLEYIDFFNFLGFDIVIFSESGEHFPIVENHYNGLITIVLDEFIASKSSSAFIYEQQQKNLIFKIVFTVIMMISFAFIFILIEIRPKIVYTYNTNIKQGEVLTSDMLDKKEISYKEYENGMILNSNAILGKIAKKDIKSGVVVYEDQLYDLSSYIGNINFNIESGISLNKENTKISFKNLNEKVDLVYEIYKGEESLGKTQLLKNNQSEDIELYSLLEQGDQELKIKIFAYQKNGELYKEYNKKVIVRIDKDNKDENLDVHIPSYGNLDISEEYPNVELTNPKENNVNFVYTIYEDDNILYETKTIKPGEMESVDLMELLGEGEHNLSFKISTYNIETQEFVEEYNQEVNVYNNILSSALDEVTNLMLGRFLPLIFAIFMLTIGFELIMSILR